MEIQEHLIVLLKILYTNQEATLGAEDGETDWLQVCKGDKALYKGNAPQELKCWITNWKSQLPTINCECYRVCVNHNICLSYFRDEDAIHSTNQPTNQPTHPTSNRLN